MVLLYGFPTGFLKVLELQKKKKSSQRPPRNFWYSSLVSKLPTFFLEISCSGKYISPQGSLLGNSKLQKVFFKCDLKVCLSVIVCNNTHVLNKFPFHILVPQISEDRDTSSWPHCLFYRGDISSSCSGFQSHDCLVYFLWRCSVSPWASKIRHITNSDLANLACICTSINAI